MEQTRPNRSDVHLDAEESAKLEAAARHYFDEAAPKRHTKPQRSEYSSAYTDALSAHDSAAIPEHIQFQRLEKDDNQKLVYGASQVPEEFTETEYYQDLNGVDKQHHTTGTGFIKVDNSTGGNGFNLAPDVAAESHPPSKGNPATNDWIPANAAADKVDVESGKPSRSG
ncbi:uncharacterized protein LOC127244103 isoform X2 [Andrographis paniculata]|uniref:uncharacterized protein LOC127244103 isoform X2 n=1 Tax=Andrographis paniculata TaxID=175694 RepID=UPI0021E76AA4|nr:uncharacterized protein LOC127244103 isoform X2 [Andrographis paniculata]